MKARSKTLCLSLALLVCVFSSSYTHGADTGTEAGIAWLAEQIANHLEDVTGDTFGASFRELIATMLDEEKGADAAWYQALGKAYGGCEAAGADPSNAVLQSLCEADKQLAIEEALRVLETKNLPASLLAAIDEALGRTAPEGDEQGIPVLDPQTSQAEAYWREGREVSPSQ
ncbi:MAG: hypothetical protein JRJ47_12395 [Deltaproteobacteria bacterium]|nr:hypothetical protein [Deltaproteobacteria bacterium]